MEQYLNIVAEDLLQTLLNPSKMVRVVLNYPFKKYAERNDDSEKRRRRRVKQD